MHHGLYNHDTLRSIAKEKRKVAFESPILVIGVVICFRSGLKFCVYSLSGHSHHESMGSSGEDAIHPGATKHRGHCDLWIKIGSQKVSVTHSHVSRVAGGLSSNESASVRVVASTLGYVDCSLLTGRSRRGMHNVGPPGGSKRLRLAISTRGDCTMSSQCICYYVPVVALGQMIVRQAKYGPASSIMTP